MGIVWACWRDGGGGGGRLHKVSASGMGPKSLATVEGPKKAETRGNM